ncbi:MAG: nucleotidyltransferase domain-containing protein [Nanoarchaeota archaeon]|nr:nucleotidyltransferase domain-containing protein [Nanoarchaeota archaeon]
MVQEEIPEMNKESKYNSKDKNILPEDAEKVKKEMEKTKEKLEKLKGYIVNKYKYTQAIGILPPQSLKFFIEEEEAPKETDKHIHLLILIPEENIKEAGKIKEDIIKEIEKSKQKIWLHIKTPVDLWETCLDSKFELFSAMAMAFPLYDKGILAAIRVAEIHKSLVLRKFERYVVSYVIAGSMVRGDATKTSDLDVFVIINDTDVKRMPRLELREKLRSIICGEYVMEANALAGVKKNILNVQPYLLTEFWESVKDAHPVIFTFIRDGIPIYDRGTFMPWKVLLKMGKLKPSPEAIDMFMSMGDKVVKRVKDTLLDAVLGDIYWGVITPSQALLMLYGLPPPNTRETVNEMRKIFVEKEKMLEKKYIDILEEIAIKYYKGYEHKKIKEVSGKEVDKLLKDVEDYLKRLKELREQIEKRAQEKTIGQIYKDVFSLLEAIFGKEKEQKLIREFGDKMVKTGKFPQQFMVILKDIANAKDEFKKGKLDMHKVERARKNASMLINGLVEYSQRCDLALIDKGRMRIKYKEKKDDKEKIAELVFCNGQAFLVAGDVVKKITNKIEDSNSEEMSNAVSEQRNKKEVGINPQVFEVLRKEFGDFEIII